MPEITDYRKWAEDKMLEMNRGKRRGLLGCTTREIEELMAAQSVSRLPQAIYELLRIAGKSGLDALFSCDFSKFYYLLTMKDEATIILAEYDLTMPNDAFVFYDHQGEQIMFILTDNDSDDPPVFQYLDEKGIFQSRDRISELVEYGVKEYLRYWSC